MADDPALDVGTLVWAAALVEDRDPAEVLVDADVAVLDGIAREVAGIGEPVEAAAALLERLVRERPFAGAASAIAWLATVDLLRTARLPVRAAPRDVRVLCRDLRSGRAGRSDATTCLLRWTPGIPCPACGRRVYVAADGGKAIALRQATPYELTARCAYEHRTHGRSGRPLAPTTSWRDDLLASAAP